MWKERKKEEDVINVCIQNEEGRILLKSLELRGREKILVIPKGEWEEIRGRGNEMRESRK